MSLRQKTTKRLWFDNWGIYYMAVFFGVGHKRDVYDDPSLIRLNELGSMDLVCRGGGKPLPVSLGWVNYCRKSLAKRYSELVYT